MICECDCFLVAGWFFDLCVGCGFRFVYCVVLLVSRYRLRCGLVFDLDLFVFVFF